MAPHLSHEAIDGIGYAAAMLTTFSFIPQVLKSWRSRSTDDISAAMLVAFTTGVALWLCYGLALGSVPVVLANSITLALSGALVLLKVRGRQ